MTPSPAFRDEAQALALVLPSGSNSSSPSWQASGAQTKVTGDGSLILPARGGRTVESGLAIGEHQGLHIYTRERMPR